MRSAGAGGDRGEFIPIAEEGKPGCFPVALREWRIIKVHPAMALANLDSDRILLFFMATELHSSRWYADTVYKTEKPSSQLQSALHFLPWECVPCWLNKGEGSGRWAPHGVVPWLLSIAAHLLRMSPSGRLGASLEKALGVANSLATLLPGPGNREQATLAC